MNFKKSMVSLVLCVALVFSAMAIVSANTVKPGDTNEDGAINTKDVLVLRKYLAKWEVSISLDNADINQDGLINTKDVLILRKALAHLVNIEDYTVTTIPTQAPTQAQPIDALGSNLKTVGDKLNSPISNEEYKLVWIDDFEGDKLDESNWSYFTRNYNQAEESVNRKENIEVSNGTLNIYARLEDQEYTGDAESWETPKVSNLTSGAINTQGKQSFQYGRLEIKCKIPYSYGMWAAFWTMGENKGWPWCGETDIMEFVGGTAWGNDRDNEYHSGLHWCDPDLSSDYAWSTSTNVGVLDTEEGDLPLTSKLGCGGEFELADQSQKLNDEWHICGVEWTEKTMTFYCDDEEYLTIDITRESMRKAFHQPHYIILDLVMGGSWAGTPDESTVFPQSLEVDWIKVWQK